MAAAICWENYMPLVRQALYSQNINLYLAPTADQRDTWLPLIRTAAIEGRCFVITSNMCVRDTSTSSASAISPSTPTTTAPRPPTPISTSAEEDSSALQFSEPVSSSATPAPPSTTTAALNRRNSCVTEEGFEIALPSPSPNRARQLQSTNRRRQSVFDDDGNEIVLPCGKGATAGERSKSRVTSGHVSMGRIRGREGPATGTGGGGSFVSRGGSAIVSPFGDVLAGPQWEDDEGLVYTDVDFEDCIRGRLDLDTAGSYSRYVLLFDFGLVVLKLFANNSGACRNDSFKFSVEGLDLTPLPY